MRARILRSRRNEFMLALGGCLLFGVSIGCSTPPHSAKTPASATPSSVHAEHGLVVAAEPLAARAGLSMLERGGNAIDAAVATGFALAVTYPVAGNIGGGGFLVAAQSGTEHRDPAMLALDFREIAPGAASPGMYELAAGAGREEASTLGAMAAGVPGSVAGMLEALERWGTLDRRVVLEPAIALARDGFDVPKRTADFLAAPGIARRMRTFESTAAIYYPGGEPLQEGERLVQPDLAATLERIAEAGADGFYRGRTADLITRAMLEHGGLIAHDDLEQYTAVQRTPVKIAFRDHTVVTMPLPSSAGVCLTQILGFVDCVGLDKEDAGSPAAYHTLAEAMRRSFLDRNAYLGDPDRQPKIDVDALRSDDRLRAFLASFDPDRATPTVDFFEEATTSLNESEETTHYSVFDGELAVSVTTTLNGAFGSKLVVPGAGFFLNNEMDDFATRPGKPNFFGLVQGQANEVRPRARPLSSMSPTVVLDADGQVRIVAGTPGGPTIITNVCQVLVNLLVFGFDPQRAVDAPKIHHQAVPDQLSVEKGIPEHVRTALIEMGHTLRERSAIGDFQLIVVDEPGSLRGATDARGGGAAVGY